jgi:hypothetical protein
MVFALSAGRAFAVSPKGGACPASSPVAGSQNCFFIAANGSDTNSGASESTPWLHAPGMPNCSGTCATVQSSFGGYGSAHGGVGLIFRGGDTWHLGITTDSTSTGGTWTPQWPGTSASTCVYEGTQSGCFYIGVDTAWYNSSNCSSWCRPILNGDNPTSTSIVSSCPYQTGPSNDFVVTNTSYQYWDSFEFTGLCSQDTTNVGNSSFDAMFVNNGCGNPSTCSMMTIIDNFYMHGWTVSTATQSNGALQCYAFGGGSLTSFMRIVVDGSDSVPGACAWGIFPDIHHMKDSMFRYVTQGVANWCHDIHDNIFEHFYNPYVPTHGNGLECNGDATGNAMGQPQGTPNVFYNNVMRHFDPSFGKGGQVDLWFCPNTVPEYWFNNLMYDLNAAANQGSWDIAGPPTYAACTNSGGNFMFNNTLVDTQQPCHLGPNNSGGRYLTVVNEHLINSPWDSTAAGGCIGGPGNSPSASNVQISDAAATSQGYTTGSPGNSFTNTCANDATTPCTPMSAKNSTVGKGGNLLSYCATLASYTAEPAIATDAANACKYSTTDGCSYNTISHTMICPSMAWPAVLRPAAAAWDSGAYQFPGPPPPTNPTGSVAAP